MNEYSATRTSKARGRKRENIKATAGKRPISWQDAMVALMDDCGSKVALLGSAQSCTSCAGSTVQLYSVD
jgi:hypothetical protein